MPSHVSRKKRFSRAGSCSSVGNNDDLVTEILVLLPAKTVITFKTVSKQWLSLISSQWFTAAHIRNHGRRSVETQHSFVLAHGSCTSHFFICDPRVKNKLVQVTLPPDIRSQQKLMIVLIVQSANGLLLLSLKFPDRVDYIIFNPATKRSRLIDLDGHRPIKVCLIFDPSKSKIHYKLAMITSAATPLAFSVYDSATHKWSHGKDSVYEESSSMLCKLGLCYSTLGQGHHCTHHLLLVHNNDNVYENYIIESNQHLSILQLNRRRSKVWFRVGVMIEEKWVFRKRSSVVDFGNRTIGLLGMIREESIEDSAILFHVPGKLLIYRFSNGLEVLVDYRSNNYVEDQLQFQYAHPFVHSFAPV